MHSQDKKLESSIPSFNSYNIVALDSKTICIAKQDANIHDAFGADDTLWLIDINTRKAIDQFYHTGLLTFCASKDGSFIITASTDVCHIWQVKERKAHKIDTIDMSFIKDFTPNKMILCDDNMHLFYLSLSQSISVINLSSRKISTINLHPERKEDRDVYDVYGAIDNFRDFCLLQQEDQIKLVVVAGENGLLKYDVDFAATEMLFNPDRLTQEKYALSCVVSQDDSCLVVGHGRLIDETTNYKIYRVNADFSLTDFGNFETSDQVFTQGFLDEHRLALVKYPENEIFTVNLDADELKPVKQDFGFKRTGRAHNSFCVMPDGDLLTLYKGKLALLPAVTTVYAQALDALFHHQMLVGLPMFSADMVGAFISYTSKPIRNLGLFKSSIVIPEHQFLDFILDSLIASPEVGARDKRAIGLFKATLLENPAKTIPECLKIVAEKVTEPGKEVNITFGLARFFMQIEKAANLLRKLEAPALR